MELLSIVLCLSAIFGYITGNIAVIIIVTSKIRVQPKATRYILKVVAALFSLILVNFPLLLYTPTAFYIIAEGGTMKFDMESVFLLCWISAVVLFGWIGILRDWYLKCKVMQQ